MKSLRHIVVTGVLVVLGLTAIELTVAAIVVLSKAGQ
jgi:hypothetical protein